jgi:hypothetical protein
MRKYIIPFIITDLDYRQIPDQSDEHTARGCEVECITNLDQILDKGDRPIVEKRWFEKKLILKKDSREYDIGCLQIEHHDDHEKNDNPSIEMQVFYGKEIYDMLLPIILNAYHNTKVYSILMQRHRDEQIGKLFD